MEEGNTNEPQQEYFENIDITKQPDLRVPSPQQSLWHRFWQPIGTTVMDTGVLKEPRGFMRMVEWFFAICAFASCCNFSTLMDYTVHCNDDTSQPIKVMHNVSYPFTLGNHQAVNVTCHGQTIVQSPPGDFESDAQFFVFTGVISFLSTMALLVLYVFFAPVYNGPSKTAPMADFAFTVIIAIFWLSASAAWANGLTGIKNVLAGSWVFAKESICEKNANATYALTIVKKCDLGYSGSFGGANVSVIFGFLNFFLWAANLWFIYKETPWFAGAKQQQGNLPETLEG